MKLNISLTRKGDVQKAIEALEEYKRKLVDKETLFCQRLAEIGVMAASAKLSTGDGDSSRLASFSIDFIAGGENVSCVLSITSVPNILEDGRTYYPHLGWEFGAGIYYNNGNVHPKAHELGMGVGTFPDQTNAMYNHWWYRDEGGNLHLSRGTQATMPMHTATVEMIQNIEAIAKEVYGGR